MPQQLTGLFFIFQLREKSYQYEKKNLLLAAKENEKGQLLSLHS